MQTENLIPKDATQVGVMISGGLDSTLLLYLLTKENKTRTNPVDLITLSVERKNAMVHVNRAIETVERLNNVTIKNMVVGDPTVDSDYQVISGALDALSNKKIPLVFLATTAVPDNLHLEAGFAPPVRDPKPRTRVIQPWVLETKDQVVKYIVEHNLFDLVKVTHSCTVEDMSHCGKCFNCVERKWAFDANNASDSTDY